MHACGALGPLFGSTMPLSGLEYIEDMVLKVTLVGFYQSSRRLRGRHGCDAGEAEGETSRVAYFARLTTLECPSRGCSHRTSSVFAG
jgi:hypothetical protein